MRSGSGFALQCEPLLLLAQRGCRQTLIPPTEFKNNVLGVGRISAQRATQRSIGECRGSAVGLRCKHLIHLRNDLILRLSPAVKLSTPSKKRRNQEKGTRIGADFAGAVRGEEQGFPGVAGMRPPAFGMSPTLRLVRFDPPKVASHSLAAGRPCSASRGDTPMLAATRCGKNSDGFGRPQTACRTGAVRRTPVAAARLRRLRREVIQTRTPLPRAPCLYSGSLERSAEQWRPKEEQDSRVSECRVAARVSRLSLLRPEPRRAPMRKASAQGRVSFPLLPFVGTSKRKGVALQRETSSNAKLASFPSANARRRRKFCFAV